MEWLWIITTAINILICDYVLFFWFSSKISCGQIQMCVYARAFSSCNPNPIYSQYVIIVNPPLADTRDWLTPECPSSRRMRQGPFKDPADASCRAQLTSGLHVRLIVSRCVCHVTCFVPSQWLSAGHCDDTGCRQRDYVPVLSSQLARVSVSPLPSFSFLSFEGG